LCTEAPAPRRHARRSKHVDSQILYADAETRSRHTHTHARARTHRRTHALTLAHEGRSRVHLAAARAWRSRAADATALVAPGARARPLAGQRSHVCARACACWRECALASAVDVMSQVPGRMWQGLPSPGADVVGVSPVPAQMWGTADVASVIKVPGRMWHVVG
jgi:hypothetical protein